MKMIQNLMQNDHLQKEICGDR